MRIQDARWSRAVVVVAAVLLSAPFAFAGSLERQRVLTRYEAKHVAIVIPEAGKELLHRVSAIMMRVEFPEAVLLNGRVAVDASNRTMQAFELAEALECDDLDAFELQPVVRPTHQDWTLVPLPAYQPELRLVWEASALCQETVRAPTIWLALVHPVDPLGGAVLPALESCRVRFTKNASYASGQRLPRFAPLSAYWPDATAYAAPTPAVATHLHHAAAAFVASDAWHATVLVAASHAREWTPFTASVRPEEDLEAAPRRAGPAAATGATPSAQARAGRRRLLGDGSAADLDAVLAVGEGDEPVDAAAFSEGVQASAQLRATPEVASLADGDGGAARFRAAREAEAAARAKAKQGGKWSSRGEDGRYEDPDRTPALFDRVPSAYEARSAEDVRTQHVFLQQNEAATALDVMLVGMRGAYEGHALPELKVSGYASDRPTRAAVKTARVLREQDVSLSFIEASSKVSTLMQVGVKSREVFSMIVDSIMNHLPEIIANVVMAVAAEPAINMVGKALSCVLPPILVPSTGAVPCIAPGADGLPMPVTEVEAPPCVCAGPKIPVFDFLQLSDAGFLPKSGDKSCSCSNANGAALVETTTENTDKDALASTMLQHMKAKADDAGGPLPKIMEKVTPNINEAIKANAMPSVEANVAAKLSETLPERIRTQTHRKTTRILMTQLTQSVTMGVVQELSRLLGRELTFTTTRTLVRALVPTLTHSLAPAMTMALTHSPKSDYYCAYCSSKKMYCEYCAKSKQADYMTEYYTNYYASYYSAYYTENYVAIGDLVSQEALA